MIKKINLFCLFAVALLICGCVKKTPQAPSSQTNVNNESKQKENENVSNENKKVKIQTNMGDIVIELNAEKAPFAVKNFLSYVENGFYNGTIFHRVVNSPTLHVIQAGGFDVNMNSQKTNPPIKNEASNGLKNDRGTIAMGQTPRNPDSATSHFYINHKDNPGLDYTGISNPGYTVFGKVIEGMDVVDKIASVKTTVRNGMSDVPVELVMINSATVVSQ
ncbi:MAG: peptidylprolyl isomerase [Sedimentisphaerales bacterium]|nr:peptidylprolyl isomerase [Sedimentisphaerales bacterium]